ncbi:DUF6894 family protein [Methylobacterium oxalidis]|uniref:DUF6894 family protein n=1 Tax=Methylobacterium oxalidis TaxID=944322 RepID=UPI0033153797
MPTRYFFRLISDTITIEDETGAVADGDDQARSEALAAIKEFREAGLLSDVEENWHLEVRDELGRLIQLFYLA